MASTLQRFTSDKVKNAKISLYSHDLKTATYQVDLEKITYEQYYPKTMAEGTVSVVAADDIDQVIEKATKFTLGHWAIF